MPKSQHEPAYRPAPPFLRQLRERAGLTQRALGQRLRRPQSWVYNCESANRRVDVAEFIQETYVFHLHLYEWHAAPQDRQSPRIDAVSVSPQTGHTIEPP